jgi:hypothetical protein
MAKSFAQSYASRLISSGCFRGRLFALPFPRLALLGFPVDAPHRVSSRYGWNVGVVFIGCIARRESDAEAVWRISRGPMMFYIQGLSIVSSDVRPIRV